MNEPATGLLSHKSAKHGFAGPNIPLNADVRQLLSHAVKNSGATYFYSYEMCEKPQVPIILP